MNIAILTSCNQWFIPYAQKLNEKLDDSTLFFNHDDLTGGFDVLFILSYHKIIPEKILKNNKHNIVIHASALPQGKGWAPMFWQILEGKSEVPFTMFEASSEVDNGSIYMQRTLSLTGYELHYVLRDKQAKITMKMCLDFVNNYSTYSLAKEQQGKESFYNKRTSKDSELAIDKTIKENFNLLRIVDNEAYPAFFEIDGERYILKIEKAEK